MRLGLGLGLGSKAEVVVLGGIGSVAELGGTSRDQVEQQARLWLVRLARLEGAHLVSIEG